jgi:hypothetical protein
MELNTRIERGTVVIEDLWHQLSNALTLRVQAAVGWAAREEDTHPVVRMRAPQELMLCRRFMGASLAMIDRHYGHLARGGRDHAVAPLDAYARDSAAWTCRRTRQTRSARAVAASLTR